MVRLINKYGDREFRIGGKQVSRMVLFIRKNDEYNLQIESAGIRDRQEVGLAAYIMG